MATASSGFRGAEDGLGQRREQRALVGHLVQRTTADAGPSYAAVGASLATSSTGECTVEASPNAATELAAPGPVVVSATPSPPVARARPSAA